MFRNLKISTKIVFISVLIITVSISIVSYIGFYVAKRSIEDSRIQALKSIADLKVDMIKAFFKERASDIKTAQDYYNIKTNLPIMAQYAMDRTDPAYIAAKEMLDDQLKNFQNAYGYIDIMLVSHDGKIVYVSNEAHAEGDLGHRLPCLDEEKTFEAGKKGIYFTNVFRNRLEGYEFEMIVIAPAHDFNGEFIGCIAFEIDMEPVYEFIQDTTGLGETGETLVARHTSAGALFVNPLRHDKEAALKRMSIFGEKAGFPILEAVQGRNGHGLSIDYRGEEVLAVWRYIPLLDWGLVAKIDKREAFDLITQLKIVIIVSASVILVFALTGAVFFSRTITSPVKKLSDIAYKISHGDMTEQITVKSKDEIGMLARSFDTMRIKVAELLENIGEAKQDWESTFDSVKDIIVIYGEDSRIIRCNDELLNRLNVKFEDIIGKRCYEVFHQISKEDLSKCMVTEMAKTLKPVTNELEIPCLGGIFSISNFPRFDDNGEFVGTVQIMRDITERKQAEERLKLYSYQQEQITNISRRALLGTDISTLIDEVVAIVANTLDMEFCKILELLPDGKALLLRAGVGWKEGYVGHATVGTNSESQAGYTLLSNKPVIVEDIRTETRFSAPPLLKEHGVISGMSVIIQGKKRPFGVLGVHTSRRRTFSEDDINFFNASANMLAESIERKQIEIQFRSIVDNSADGIITINEQGIIQLYNPAAEKLFGYTVAETIGQNVKMLMPEPYHSEHDNYLQRYISTGKEHIIGVGLREVWGLCSDGTTFPMELAISKMRIGEQRMFVGILRDISKRKMMEEKLRTSHKMASLGQLTAGVVHEVLNPLNIISSHVQLLLAGAEKGTKTEEDLKSIREEIDRIVEITDGLLRFSRKEKSISGEVAINSLLEKIISIVEPDMKLSNIEFIREFEDGLPKAMVNSDELRQVFLNLITNARDAMPDGGTLTVKTKRVRPSAGRAGSSESGIQSKEGKGPELKTQYSELKGDYVEITFADTGCGITKENLDKVFEPFFTTKGEGKGTGLGLSISYGIIKNHGGTLSVESEVGKGTTFIIDLPIKD